MSGSTRKPQRSHVGFSLVTLPFIAMRTDVRIEQHLAGLAERQAARGAAWMLELEIPVFPTLRTPVMGHNLDLALTEIALG
jgi:hypothetical protein